MASINPRAAEHMDRENLRAARRALRILEERGLILAPREIPDMVTPEGAIRAAANTMAAAVQDLAQEIETRYPKRQDTRP